MKSIRNGRKLSMSISLLRNRISISVYSSLVKNDNESNYLKTYDNLLPYFLSNERKIADILEIARVSGY